MLLTRNECATLEQQQRAGGTKEMVTNSAASAEEEGAGLRDEAAEGERVPGLRSRTGTPPWPGQAARAGETGGAREGRDRDGK